MHTTPANDLKPNELAAWRSRCAGERGSAPAPDEAKLDAWWKALPIETKAALASSAGIPLMGVVS